MTKPNPPEELWVIGDSVNLLAFHKGEDARNYREKLGGLDKPTYVERYILPGPLLAELKRWRDSYDMPDDYHWTFGELSDARVEMFEILKRFEEG